MAPPSQLIQYPQLLTILLLLAAARASDEHGLEEVQQRVGRPDCRDRCGGMSIPFPFGMDKPGCFLPGFEVTCNTSYTPPRAFLAYNPDRDGAMALHEVIYEHNSSSYSSEWTKSQATVELFDISLETSEVRVYGAVNSRCFSNLTEAVFKGKYMLWDEEGPFLLSSTRNELIGVGWDVEPWMSDNFESTTGYSFTLSCTSLLLISLDLATNGSCSGLGCCQIAMPKQRLPVIDTGVSFKPVNNGHWDTNPCSYGMALERSRYNFSTEDLYGYEVLSKKLSRGIPLVLDFAIRNGSCAADGCLSGNSSCANAANGRGYVCKCEPYYHGNPYIVDGCRDIIVGASSIIFVCLLLFACLLGYKRHGSKIMLVIENCTGRISKRTQRIESFLQKNETPYPKRFKYSEVKRITKYFTTKLGQGGFGVVYRGNLSDGRQVAVEMLQASKGDGEEFINEVASISRTSHVNIVSLLGFCMEGSKRALIYEYKPNGSLERYVFNSTSKNAISISWEKLFDIGVGIARGLEYLHRGCSTHIVHFDIKPHNILLDQEFCPRISDFGMAKLCVNKESVISIGGARGTIGYITPEVFSKQFEAVSSKSDVYSYGMMVLEMVGAREKTINIDSESSSQYFPQWIYDHVDDYCVDTSEINGEITEIVRKMIVVGLWCIQVSPANRPTMTRVVEMLEGTTRGLELPPRVHLSCLENQVLSLS